MPTLIAHNPRAVMGVKPSIYNRGWARVVIAAGGPSFSEEQARILRNTQEVAAAGWHIIAVNDTYLRLPRADAMYASDFSWWLQHIDAVQASFPGEKWTQDRGIAYRYNLHHVLHSHERGLCRQPGMIFPGGNGAFAAMGLAWHFGAREIALVGVDCKDGPDGQSHWHGDHPPALSQDRPYAMWLDYFNDLARELHKEGVQVWNCSNDSALAAFPSADLSYVLYG